MLPNDRLSWRPLSFQTNRNKSLTGTKRTFAALQQFVRYWVHSGHWPKLVRNALVANDPKRSLGREVLAGFEIKKTAPVRARVCAVVVEDSHRRKEQSATLCTTVSNYFAESRTNKFPFMGWRPLYASETTMRLRSNRATGSA